MTLVQLLNPTTAQTPAAAAADARVLEADGTPGPNPGPGCPTAAPSPSPAFSSPASSVSVPFVCPRVRDVPSFGWRGLLLDVGRHFFPVPFVKRVLDLLALHKVNKFHWHLTEDQGWRIEIRAFPRLTEVGAWRASGGSGGDERYGGFYSQDDVREIVAYAAERFIDVVPEIELPGHCGAALAAYPHLCCRGSMDAVPAEWGVHSDVYCAGNDAVFEFLKAVLTEVIELFPFEFIHIGGDECPKTTWAECPKCQERMRKEGLDDEVKLQAWFVAHMGRWLAERCV